MAKPPTTQLARWSHLVLITVVFAITACVVVYPAAKYGAHPFWNPYAKRLQQVLPAEVADLLVQRVLWIGILPGLCALIFTIYPSATLRKEQLRAWGVIFSIALSVSAVLISRYGQVGFGSILGWRLVWLRALLFFPMCYLLWLSANALITRKPLLDLWNNNTGPTDICKDCHYDLRGLKNNTCPECGQPIAK